MATITACILASQDSAVLRKAIHSVSFCDQIVIGTDNSTFPNIDTIQVCKLDFPISNNYARARNEIAKRVQSDWVLWLDSDEECRKDKDFSLTTFLANTPHQAFALPRFDFFMGKMLRWGELKNTWLTRLYKTTNSGKFVGAVHEVYTVSQHQNIDKLPNMQIWHYSHTSISDFFSKISKYAQLASTQNNDSKTVNWFKLLFFPIGKATHNIVWNQAWRDGWRGVVYSYLMSLHSLFVRIFKIEQNEQKK